LVLDINRTDDLDQRQGFARPHYFRTDLDRVTCRS
jgi:hypothetical protein